MEPPLSLLELASRSLLKNEALDPSSLQDLPMDFLFPVFVSAFKGGHTQALKSIVQAWPFPSLPLGTLLKTPDVETLEKVLDGLGRLLSMKDRPREWKLQVVDLQPADESLWKTGCGLIARACSELPSDWTTGNPGSANSRSTLKIFADLCITFEPGPLNDFQVCLLHWVKMRREVVQLHCKRLKILSDSMYKIRKFLRVVRLDSIEELEVENFFHREAMKSFAPYLGRMSKLRKFSFHHMSPKFYTSVWQNRIYSRMYAAHLKKLENLRELYLDEVFFLKGQLGKILISHTPLETLCLKSSPLLESDVKHLAECPSTRQLKHLTLSNIDLRDFSPRPLRALLEKVAGTLESLVLELCAMEDSHIDCILPALDCCSHLTSLSCYGNYMSLSVLERLLRHTARMSQLSQAWYPVPSTLEEGYWHEGDEETFALASSRLRQVVLDLGLKHHFGFSVTFLDIFSFTYYSLQSNGQWELRREYKDELFRWTGSDWAACVPCQD